MTKTKKVVALVLAFLMIFSSASVLASAWDVAVDDGSSLEISTKFFKEVDGAWVETTKVAPGETVEARVYLATDYYSNDSDLLFFYDKDFFTHSYGEGQAALEVNSEADVTGSVKTNMDVSDYVDSTFSDEYASFAVSLDVGTTSNIMFDGSTWLFKFTLTVLDTATGEGDLFVEESTIQSTSNTGGYISVPKGPAEGNNTDAWPMWLWDANVTVSSQPVSTLSSVTFNANEGTFADGTAEVVCGTDIGDAVTAPDAPERAGYTFIGWIDAADDTPTLDEAKATVVVTEIPEDPMTYNAFWLKNVNITFDTDSGSEIAPIENVTPYTDFADVADPTKEGYTFVGWDVRGGKLPDTYPDVDTTYTAIWALNVTVSFDTDGGTEIPSVDGFEGDTFGDDANEVIPNPTKAGHRFIMWSPALPDVYPEADTTYTAIYETKVYSVRYFVDGKIKATVELEYGQEIPTNVTSVKAPEGYELTGWYTDADCTVEFTGGTMGEETVMLYTKTQPKTYNAIYMVDGEVYDTIPVVYDTAIIAPDNNPTKVGYEFVEWTPDVGGIFNEANDMTFYATWTEVERNVEYYSDGALYETFNVETGAEIDVPADAYKEGYTFLGWADTADATAANVTFPQTMPALAEGETVKYYAVFEINSYDVIWDVDGITTKNTYEYNATIVAPSDPVKEGYTFTGWEWTNTGSDEVISAPADMKMPAYDVTATATWKVNSYTVTWNVDGAETVENYDYNADITIMADPVKAGYDFAGWTWTKDSDSSAITAPATMPAYNVTATAKWNAKGDTAYTVEIYEMETDGVNYELTETVSDLTGATDTTASYVVAAKDGFTVNSAMTTGYTADDNTANATIAGDGSTVIKVYYDRNSYKVVTDVDGVETEVDNVLYGAVIAEPAAPDNKTGHTFAGWAEYTENMTMPVGGQTFTATWTVNNYTVTWDVDGAATTSTVAYGAAVTAPADPTKTGYTFAGWSWTKTEDGAAETAPTTMPAYNLTATATWTTNEYTLTWDVDGATTTTKVLYGAEVVAPADPAKEGHTFAGWSPEVPETQGVGDVTYTATWTVNNYDLTWKIDGEVYQGPTSTAYGTEIVAPVPTRDGYTFSGWSGYTAGMTMPAEATTFEGSWIADSDTTYKVETYIMGTDGTYGTPGVETKSGTTDSTVTVAHETKEGFTPDMANSVLSGTVAADDSLVLKIYYSRNQYALYTKNDADSEAVKVADYYYEATVAEPAEPTKTGYTFAGWDGYTDGMTMPIGDVTLTATWTANTDTDYKVVINYNDGANNDVAATVETTLEGTTGNAIVIVDATPADPAADTEYVLWSTLTANWADAKYYELDEDAANDDYIGGTKIAADGSTVINVYYTPVIYTATFDAGEGAWADGSKTATATMDHFEVVKDHIPATEPTRTGYTFGGWNGVETSLSSNRTFTAKWTANNYTVTWDVDGSTSTTSVTYNAAITAPLDPTKEGHTFAGWSWTKTADGAAETAPTTMPAYDLTATATWTTNEYTLTWDVDGATSTTKVLYGEEVVAPADPTKTGHTFAGWSPEVPETQGAGDVTYTATWTVNNYTVTWDVDGATTTSTVAYGAAVTAPADPTKTGYTFAGWSWTKTEDGAAETAPATMPAYNLTATATWTTNEYTLTWDVDGVTSTTKVLYGEEVVAPADPVKTGYTFTGWSPEVPETQGAGDVTYTAQWKVNQYKAVFNSGDGVYADGTTSKEVMVNYGETPVAPETPSREGYGFAGWTPALAPMGIDGATYTATYTAGAVNYTVETYIMDTEGNYGTPTTETKSGTADTEATVAHEAKDGFTPDTANSVLSGNIAANGSLVLKLYYSRNQYALYTKYDADSEAVKVADYYYEATIAEPAAPADKEGYTFAGWDGYTAGMTMPVAADGVTFTAKWNINQYTVTYANTGDTTIAGVTADYGTAIDAVDDPTKTGYTFGGWVWTKTETGETVTAPTTIPAYDVTATAQWTINQYTVTYANTGDTTIETVKADYGTAIDAVDDPTKTGYSFGGWVWTNTETGETVTAPTTIPAYDVTATAQWTKNSYVVTWNVDGATTTNTYEYEAAIQQPVTPTKTGNTFDKWVWTNTDTGASVDAPTTMPAYNVTATATWTVNEYTLTYRTYNGIYQETKVAYGTELTEPTGLTREGYTFTGWSPEVPDTMPASNFVTVAQWSINQYTVTYANTGDTTIANVTADYGTAIDAVDDPTKTGYTFSGWVWTNTETGETVTAPTTIPAYNVTATAQWTINQYTVTYANTGDTTIAGVTADYGTAIDAVDDPTKTGYTFGGWVWTKTETGETVTAPTTIPAYDVTATAQWTTNEYTLTWDVDGATTTTKVLYGAEVVAPADPAKEGHTFAGWSPEVPETQGVGDVTYTATWTVNNYDLTWKIDGEVYQGPTSTAYGTEIVAPVPTRDGYTFSGWSGYTAGMTMPAAATTFEGSWIADTDTTYKVETYIMGTDGTYGTPGVETKSAATDSVITLTHEDKAGFTPDMANSVLSGTVAADNSLVLKVYYSRNQYALKTNVDGTETEVGQYYYEAVIAEPAAPDNKTGHTFAGWDGYTAGMTMPVDGTTFTAKWTVNNYTVTWDVDGATTTSTVAYGAAVTAPADPTKTGYTFAGWSWTKTEDGAAETAPATMPAYNLTATATWTTNEYTLTWDVDGVTSTTKVLYGEEVVAPADPVKTGYTFTGWSPEVPETQGAGDVTYTAQFTINQYTVTYANTGDTTIETVKADYGTAIADVADPTWAGYTFRSWTWTDAEGNVISKPATIPAYNVTATAQWTANNYTITWVVDGATTAIDNYDFGADITAPADPEKAGYTFAGWSWAKNVDGVAGDAVASSTTMPAYNVIATAQWTAKGDTAYTVAIYKMATDGATYELVDTKTGLTGATGSTATYVVAAETGFTVNAGMTTGYDADANTAKAEIAGDGSTVIKVYYDRNAYEITINGKTEEYYYGEEIPEPTKPTPPEGNEQDGWVDENGDPVEFPLTVDTDNPTEIKPNYTKLSYTVTWTIEGTATTDTYEYDAAVTAPEIPVKEGYRIVGWTDETGAIVTVPEKMPAKNLAYTALYEVLTYGINYYVDGELVATLSAEYGDTIRTEAYAAPTGYSFDGWYTDEEMTTKIADGATVTANQTYLYGKTTANMYDAIFMVDGEVYDTVETAFDAQIEAPEDPQKEGYTFIGWTPDVAIMDEEGKTFTANWEETADAYEVFYMWGTEEGAETYESFKHAIGEEVDIPADPYKEGYTFAGWVDADGNAAEIADVMPAEDLTYYASWTVNEYTVTWYIEGTPTKQTYAYGAEITAPEAAKENFEFVGWAETEGGATVTVPKTMPAEDLVYYAVFSQNVFTVTYYDYEESEKGPAGDPAPELTKLHATQTYDAGTALALPDEPAIEHYIFTGWVDAEGNALVEGAEVTANAVYYATYEREVVKLLPVEGTTIVIERNGVTESYNDNSVTSEYNYTTTNYNKYYIYGFALGRSFPTAANIEGKSIEVQGDGYLVITLREGQTTRLGTGATVELYDNVTGKLVESFYIVVFGDLNGDGMILPADDTIVDLELNGTRTWSNQRGSSAVWYMIKAANLDGQGMVLPADATLLAKYCNGLATIDQVTGIATDK